jgi:hypothetical protein
VNLSTYMLVEKWLWFSYCRCSPLYPLSLPANSGSKHKHTKNWQASAARLIIWLHSRRPGQIRAKQPSLCACIRRKRKLAAFQWARHQSSGGGGALCHSYIKKGRATRECAIEQKNLPPRASSQKGCVRFRVRRGLGHFGN